MSSNIKYFYFLIITLLFFIFPNSIFATIEFNISKFGQIADEVTFDVSITGLTSQSCTSENKCYLQGAFQKNNGDNYFGYTQNNSGDWYEYTSSLSVDNIISNFFYFEPQSGSWSGQIKAKNNPTSSSYLGPSEYIFKLKRYSGKSTSSAGDSNTLSINFVETTPSPTQAPTAQPTSAPTQAPITAPTVKPTPTKSPTSKPTTSPTPTEESEETGEPIISIGDVKIVEATPTGLVAGATTTNKSSTVAIIFIICGILFLGYGGYLLYNMKHKNEEINGGQNGENS